MKTFRHVKSKTLFWKAIIYRFISIGIFGLIFGFKFALVAGLLAFVIYYIYDWLFSKLFGIATEEKK